MEKILYEQTDKDHTISGPDKKRLSDEVSPAKFIPAGKTEEKTGDIINFGRYPMSSDGKSGPIKWRVLDFKDGMALLITEYGIDAVPYHKESTDITWEKCTLREWLNGEFMGTAFSSAEQAVIQETSVPADKNPDFSTSPGNATRDKVFLLSINEVKKYFPNDKARLCAPTDYAIARDAYSLEWHEVNGRAAGYWWLRSPGDSSSKAAHVSHNSFVYTFGHDVDADGVCVRPACWVDIANL